MSAERTIAAGNGKILVVDDERAMRNLVTACLAHRGHCVVTAVDGLDAIRKFRPRADEIDLVVLDVDMPQMCGPECLRHIRRIRPDMSVLMATGSRPEDGVFPIHLDERTHLLRKPFAVADLSAAVSDLLQPPAFA